MVLGLKMYYAIRRLLRGKKTYIGMLTMVGVELALRTSKITPEQYQLAMPIAEFIFGVGVVAKVHRIFSEK